MAKKKSSANPKTDTTRDSINERDSPHNPVLTSKGCKELLMVGEKALQVLMRRGLPHVRAGNSYRFLRESVLKWMEAESNEYARRVSEREPPLALAFGSAPFFSIEELAHRLGSTRRKLREQMLEKGCPHIQLGNTILFLESSVVEWLKSREGAAEYLD